MSESYIDSYKNSPKYVDLELFCYELKKDKKTGNRNYVKIGYSEKILEKYPILNDREVLDIKYATKGIDKNKKAEKNKYKNSDAHAKIYEELDMRIQKDKQYKLWRLQWEYENRPCLLFVNYKDEILKLFAEISKNHIENIHPDILSS